MKNRLLLLLISGVLFSNYLSASETNPFPIAKLDPQILHDFMPLIMDEVAHEFSHQNDPRTRRDTRQYGFNFFKMLSGDFSYTPPPEFYQQMGAHICKAFGHEPIEFTNIILSVYQNGFSLEPHVDVSAQNLYGNAPFYFSERVYGIVVEPDTTGHLYFSRWEGNDLKPPLDIEPIYSLNEQAGTIFCLEGDFRQAPYFHAVSPVSNNRISITFRTVEKTH